MKFVKATKYGGSVIVPLTGIATEGEEYLVREKDGLLTVVLINTQR